MAEKAVELSNRLSAAALFTLADLRGQRGEERVAVTLLEEVQRLMDGRSAEWVTANDVTRLLERYR